MACAVVYSCLSIHGMCCVSSHTGCCLPTVSRCVVCILDMGNALKFVKYTVTGSHDGAINSKEFCTRVLHFIQCLEFLTERNILDSTSVSFNRWESDETPNWLGHYKLLLINYTVQWFRVAYSKECNWILPPQLRTSEQKQIHLPKHSILFRTADNGQSIPESQYHEWKVILKSLVQHVSNKSQ